MPKEYEKLPSKDLFKKIMCRIHKEQRLLLFKRIVVYFFGLAGSIVAFVPAFQMVKTGFFDSGFTRFFSLLFSDFNIVMAHWQNFALALLEAIPVMSIIIFSVIIVVFLESLKFLARDIKVVFYLKKLIN